MNSNSPQEPVAIVGVGCRYPGGIVDPDHFWRVISRGDDLIQDIPPDRFDAAALYDPRPGKRGKIAHTQGGFLNDIDRFDAKFFGIAPREARYIDPQHRLLLETSYEALCDAGIRLPEGATHSTGVFVGIWSADYESRMQRSLADLDVYATNGGGRYTAAGRIAFAFDFRGPAFIVDTACSSSLVSVHLACQSLRSGECDLALAGGVNLILAPYVSVGYSRSRMLSTYARCRFGNEEPGGYVRSEGAGMIALKLLSHAIRDDDRVYALIRGSAVNNDGKASELLMQPAVDGQVAALEAAYRAAGVQPAAVDYVECHGTGTRAGDPVEVEALSRVLGPGRDPMRPLLLGSVKTNFGHTEAASGVAGLIKAALSLHKRRVPPSLHFNTPNPAIPWADLPVRVQSESCAFVQDRRALVGVNSFGISATNAHVVLEEFELRRSRADLQHPTPLILSAADSSALRDQVVAWKDYLRDSEHDLSDIIYTANLRRPHFEHRRALVGCERGDFIRALEQELETETEDLHAGSPPGADKPGLVFVFSGQGPRFWPFAHDRLNRSDAFRETLQRCDQVLKDLGGWSLLAELARPAESSLLTQTQYAQPALCSIQIALSEFWRACGAVPDAVVGHSMGEVPAAYVTGALSLEDAMRVIFHRGRLIQTVCGAGKMAFVEMAAKDLEQELNAYAGVTIAAVNSPGNTIISGDSAQIDALVALLNERGAFCKVLESVDFASHSPQMESIQPAMESALSDIRPREQSLAFYSTVTGSPLDGTELGAAYWARNIREPVRFADSIAALAGDFPGVFLEISPHPAMTGSVARCLEAADGKSRAFFSLKRDEADGWSLATAAGELYSAGVPLRLAAFTPRASVVSLPIYSYQKKRYWIDESKASASEPGPGRKAYRMQWLPMELPAPRDFTLAGGGDDDSAGPCLILATDENDTAREFAELCRQAGRRVRFIAHDELTAPAALEDLKAQAQARPIAVFDFRMRPTMGGGAAAAADTLIEVLASLRTLSEHALNFKYWLITEGAVNAAPEDVADLVLAPLAGFMKSLQLEQPELAPRHVDLQAPPIPTFPAAVQADALFRVFCGQSPENQIAFRHGRALVARLAEDRVAASSDRWQADGAGVYLITGGAGNIGLAVARWLVERGARNLYLTGRRDLAVSATPESADEGPAIPDLSAIEERRNAMRMLEASGARVRYFAADIGDADATRSIFDECDREGLALRGIVHAAGVFNEVPVKDLEPDRIREMFRAKIDGALTLDELSAERPLDFFILFSSAAAIWGSQGLAHYGAANAFLDAFSVQRRRSGRPALSVNWGLWAGDGMVAGEVREKWERAGIQAMSVDTCVQSLEALLKSDLDGRVVADFDLQRLRALLESRQPRSLFSGADSAHPAEADTADSDDEAAPDARAREDLASTLRKASIEQRRGLLQTRVTALVRDVLGISHADDFNGTAGFFQQGMDSLMAVQFAQKLSRVIGRKLNTAIVFDFPTVVELSEHLADLFEQDEPAPADSAQLTETSAVDATPASTPAPIRTNASASASTSAIKTPSRPAEDQRVAVIGMACRFPGDVHTPQEYWETLISGRDCIAPIPAERWSIDDYYDSDQAKPGTINTRSGGFLKNVDLFDANFFGIAPREAMSMDPQQRLTLEACWEAIESAGIPAARLRGSRTGVYMGVTMTDYYDLQKKNNDARLIDGYAGTGGFLNSVSGRVSYFFGLHGPSMAVDAACASSLVSIHLAARSVRNGECDLALAGGVNLILAPDAFVFLSAAGALAPDGRCKTFDAAADGLGRAEGVGVLLFKRLADARRDGDRILGVIRGTAVGQDGPSAGLTVPNGQAQQKVIREALTDAAIEPNDVDLVEAHGTGTTLGDPIEYNALAGVYGKDRDAKRPLYITSVKTTIGHAESAAGVAGLMKVLLSLQNKEIPPHLHFNEANPRIDLDRIPARVPTAPTPWPNSRIRRAGVSAFGVSGTLAHIIVEEAPSESEMRPEPLTIRNRPERDLYLLPLSAASEFSLQQSARELLQLLDEQPKLTLYDLCYTASLRRSHHRRRQAFVFRDHQELRNLLEQRAGARNSAELSPAKAADITNKPVFVFSGHGSQWPGMGRDLSAAEPAFREALESCAAELQPLLDWSFFDELYAKPDESRLSEAEIAQPLIFAMQVALAKLWRFAGIEPGAVLGHSMGEVAAAHVAGHLSLKDAALLIVTRSRLASRVSGRMLSVNLGRSEAEDLLRTDPELTKQISIAATNGPTSTVLSGDAAVLERVAGDLEKRDVYASFVKVKLAGHCPQVDPVLPELMDALTDIRPTDGTIPFYSTVSGQLTAGTELTAEYWSKNMRRPVLFWDTISAIRSEGPRDFIEVSPHPLLLPALPVDDSAPAGVVTVRRDSDGSRDFYDALGELFVRGHLPDWERLYPAGAAIDLPPYPFERRPYWFSSPEEGEPASASNGFLTPLLGRRRADRRKRSSRGQAYFWEREISLPAIPWIRDHRAQDSVLLPGAAFIEIVLSAAYDAFGRDETLSIQGMRFRNGLFLLEDDVCTLQCAIFPSEFGEHAFQIFSRKTGEENWTTHCEGEIHNGAAHPGETLDWPRVRENANESYPSADFYEQWAREGVQWGPCFQTPADFVYNKNGPVGGSENAEYPDAGKESKNSGSLFEIYRQVDFPEAISSGDSQYSFHPAFLDLCLQATNAAVGLFAANAEGLSGAALFHSMESFVLHRPPDAKTLLTRARLRASADGQDRKKKICDVSVYSEEGEAVATAKGVCIQFLEERIDLFPKRYLNWLYEIDWEALDPAASPAADAKGHWLIFADAAGVADGVVRILRESGNQVYTVYPGEMYGREAERFTIHPTRREDYERLFEELEALAPGAVQEIVHMWTLDCPANQELFAGSTPSDSIDRAARISCGSLLMLLQCTANDSQAKIRAVSRGALSPEGGEPAVTQSPLWGFGRSVDAEREDRWRGLIDCDPGASVSDTVERLSDELLARDGEKQVCLRSGRRLGARLKRRLPAENRTPLKISGGAWMITGGFGALGLRTARYLAEREASHIILIGRRPVPPRAEWEKLAREEDATGLMLRSLLEIEALGARVLGLSFDVGDESAVRNAIQSLEDTEWFPIRGIIHAAGISHVASIEDQSFEQLQKDYRAKVSGSFYLHKYLPATEHVVYFSSGATVLNSPLLSTYAAANAFMDALAHYRRARGESALAVNWGYWTEVGMAVENYADKGEELTRGIGGFTPEQGIQVLEYLIEAKATQTAVMPIDWQRWAEFNPEKARSPFFSKVFRVADEGESVVETTSDEFDRNQFQSATRDDQLAIVGDYAKSQLGQIMRLDAAELDPERPWNQLGFDSLMAVEFKRRIERDLGVNVPMVNFLKGQSLVELAKNLHELMSRENDAALVDGPEDFRDRRLREARQDFPLSHSQHAYWLFAQIAPDNPFYITPMALHFKGVFDEARFRESLHVLIAEHSILRSCFPVVDGSPVQRLLPEFVPELKIIDLRSRAANRDASDHTELQREIDGHIRSDAREPFRFQEQPPFRVTLLRIAEDECIALITMHHIICDGLSLSLIAARLGEIYRSGRVQRSDAQAVQYCDYVLYQREVLDPARLASDLGYWKRRLEGASLELDYPTDFPIPETASYSGGLLRWEPDGEFAKRLATAGREHGLTPFMSILSLLALRFHEWTGADEIILGTVANHRDREVLKDMPGDFTNFLPLRIEFDPELTLNEFMLTVRETVLAAYAHQHAPFAQVVEQLKLRRRPGRNPVYNAAFLLHDETAYPCADFGTELDVRSDYKTRDLANISVLDLRFEAIKSESGVRIDVEYSTDLYREETIATWMESFGDLAGLALNAAEKPLREILAMYRERTSAPSFGLKLAATFTADPLLLKLQSLLEGSGVDRELVGIEDYSQVMQFLFQESLHRSVNIVLVRPDDWLPDSDPKNLPAFLNNARDFEAALARLSPQRLWLVVVCPSTPALEARLGSEWNEFEERLRALLPADCLIARSEAGDPAQVYNPHGDRIAHLPYTDSFVDALAVKIVRRLYRKIGRPIKAIAVDCDHTLWRGVAADDGPDKLVFDQQHKSLQTFLKEQRAAGRLLCLVSKSTVPDIQAVFARDDMLLAMDDITTHRIGPGLKSAGILSIAAELNLNAADFLFIDDDAVECAEVAARIPGIPTLQWPLAEQAQHSESLLASLRSFLDTETTEEDAMRSRFYVQERRRSEVRDAAPSFDAFLNELDLKISTEALSRENSERAAQLTLRTNQFNFSGERFTAEQLAELARQRDAGEDLENRLEHTQKNVELIRVSDRFGDYGFAGLLVYSFQKHELLLHACYLSCRVLGRGVEHEVFRRLGRAAIQAGKSRLAIQFTATARNNRARNFLESIEASVTAKGYALTGEAAVSLQAVDSYQIQTDAKEPAEFVAAAAAGLRLNQALIAQAAKAFVIAQLPEQTTAAEVSPAPTESPGVAEAGQTERDAETAALICRLWGELLDLERMRPTDDFFECGGNSLQAAQFASRALFPVEISLNDIFSNPTAERLSGLIDAKIAAQAAAPINAPGDTKSNANDHEGLEGLEERIAAEWAALLGLASVGIRDDFFELGGNSLQAAQFVASSRYGETLTLNDMFRHSTAFSLGAFLRNRNDKDNE